MKQALLAVGVFAVLLAVVLATRDHGNVNVGVPRLEVALVDKTKVTSFEMTGAQTVSLKKEAAGWTVADASKVYHPADEGAVNALLEALKDVKTEVFVTEKPERLSELEIDDAKGLDVKVFTDQPAPALDLVFGKAGKTGGAYLRAPKSQQVFLTNSRLALEARHAPLRWRKRSFYPAKFEQLSKVALTLEDGSTLAVEAQPDGKWGLATGNVAPAGFRFDAAAAQRLAAAAVAGWATDFLDHGTDELFPHPHATIEATLKEGKTVRMQLGGMLPAATDGGQPAQAGTAVRVDGDPQVYLIANDQAAQLKKHLGDLRDTTLLAFDPSKAQKLVIATAGKKTVLAKEGGAWKMLEPKTPPKDFVFEPSQVDRELGQLQVLRAAAIADVPEAKAGFAKPSGTVEISLEGGTSQLLKFGGDSSTGIYVKGTADGFVYTIDRGARARLESPLEIFKKPPAPPDMGQMRGLENLPPEIRKQLEAQLRQQRH